MYIVGECKEPKKFISWGCGIQSTVLCVMSALGDIEKVDAIITAETGWEHEYTYKVRDYYVKWLEEHGQTVYIVQEGDIHNDLDRLSIPAWCDNGAPLRRQCTAYYKITPIRRKMRELCGLRLDNKGRTLKNTVHMLMGISTDEAERMSDSNRSWILNRYPLIDAGMSRASCIDYLKSKGLPVPMKSSCVICPYIQPSWHKFIKDNYHKDFQDAIEFDNKLRHLDSIISKGRTKELFLYKGIKPLSEADLETDLLREKKALDFCDSGYCFI